MSLTNTLDENNYKLEQKESLIKVDIDLSEGEINTSKKPNVLKESVPQLNFANYTTGKTIRAGMSLC